MKILIITNHYLDNNSGGSLASRAFINAFTEITDNCLLLYPDRKQNISTFVHKNCIIKGIPYYKSYLGKLFDIYLGRLNRFSKIILIEIQSFNPNLVVFDNSRSSAGIIKKVKALGIKVFTIHHNYEMQYYKGAISNFLIRFPIMYYMAKAERNAVLLSDLNLTLTNQDIELLKFYYDPNKLAKFRCIGIFENENTKITPVLSKSIDKITCAITGNLSAAQTKDAVTYFIYELYPMIRNKYPELEIIIAGRSPGDEIKNICSQSRIILIESPDDMNTVIKAAHIYICPTRLGGGLKLRIMDGLRLGLPILTHSVSARGYDDLKGYEWFKIFSSREEFCLKFDEIIDLVKKNRISNSKIQNKYQNIFSYNVGLEKLRRILHEFNFNSKSI